MKNIAIFIFLFLVVLTSCKRKNAVSGLDSSDSLKSQVENIQTSDLNSDSFSEYPVDSLFSNNVLLSGLFHDDEVWASANKEKWYGLFVDNKGFYLASTKIRTSKVYDPLDEDTTTKSGWLVQTDKVDSCIILIVAQPDLNDHRVKQANLSKSQILPGEKISFKFLDVDYQIYAKGRMERINDGSSDVNCTDYKLFVTSIKNGQRITDLLIAHEEFDDCMTTILFAGDIDGDSRLDFVIDASDNYNSSVPSIFLSKPTTEKQLVRFVGGHKSVGC
jgi:hypothetical protein